jgi:hypothetical protein
MSTSNDRDHREQPDHTPTAAEPPPTDSSQRMPQVLILVLVLMLIGIVALGTLGGR